MTPAEAIDLIPGIVNKAIPVDIYDCIKCPAVRAQQVAKARQRQRDLTNAIRAMVIRLQDFNTSVTGITVDPLAPLGRYLVVAMETNSQDEAKEFCESLHYDNTFVFDRVEVDVIVPEK